MQWEGSNEAQVAQQRSRAEFLSQPGQNVEVIAFSAVLSGFSPQLQLLPQYSEKFLSLNFSVCNCNTPKGQPRMKKLWIALLPLQLKEWLQGKEVLTEPWCDINLGMSMLSRRQQTRNWAKTLSWATLSSLPLEKMMLILYSKQLWRNNNIIIRSETSLEAILSTQLAGRSPQSLKENDWEQKCVKREELSDLLFSAIFINFGRGTSPCQGSLMLHGEFCFSQYKEALPSQRAISAEELCLWEALFSSSQCSPEHIPFM